MILGVDVGGTFTDAVLLTADSVVTGKAPSTPRDQSEGVMAAVEEALGAAGARAADVDRLVHGMTVGTNALLEGRTARTALVATEGFTDLEELGRQARPELYRLCVGRPAALAARADRVAAPERMGPDGVLRELDEDVLRERLGQLDPGVQAVAICLLWGFRHPEHERRVAEIVAELRPDVHISTSHETAAVFREYERLATTTVDAAVSPLLRDYLRRLTERTAEAGLPEPEIMLSSGGVVDASTAAAHGSWTALSGPAGGAVAAARTATALNAPTAVGLDMGGTSCDVSLILDGRVAVTGGREIAGRSLALPMIDVHTVGAGGGSIAWVDRGGALRTGPESAGADPGPACYGRGGERPTITDANLLLGFLDPSAPLAGGVTLDRDAAERAVGGLARELGLSVEEAAAGIARVGTATMAQAARVVTVERGVDPRGLALVSFGGAGGLHAAAIAEELGMSRVIAPLVGGVLSALGLAVSERRRDVVESVLLRGEELEANAIAEVVARLAQRGREELGEPDADLRVTYELRYGGQAFELPVEAGAEPDPADLRERFDAAHEERYGYADPDAALELVTIRVAVFLEGPEPPEPQPEISDSIRWRRVFGFDEDHPDALVLSPGRGTHGPAIFELPGSTLVVPPGWEARSHAGAVTLVREAGDP